MMATLYDANVRIINEHIKKVYDGSGIELDSITWKFQIVEMDGSR